MFDLVLADASLELVPKELHGHWAVKHFAEKRADGTFGFLLDTNYHHEAMKKLRDAKRRGRPDITHLCLLEALGSPLNRAGRLRTRVHTQADVLIEFDRVTRLPRYLDRFKGVMEKALVAPGGAGDLVRVAGKVPFKDTLPLQSVGFSEDGRSLPLGRVAETLLKLEAEGPVAIVVGTYPFGDFRPEVKDAVKEWYRLGPASLPDAGPRRDGDDEEDDDFALAEHTPKWRVSEEELELVSRKQEKALRSMQRRERRFEKKARRFAESDVLDAWTVVSRVLTALELQLGLL